MRMKYWPIAISSVLNFSQLLHHVEDRYRGRVFATLESLTWSTMMLSMMAAGARRQVTTSMSRSHLIRGTTEKLVTTKVADALAHLLHTEQVARPDVAVVRDGHGELELLVAGVRHVATDVKINAGSSQWRTRYAEGDRVGTRNVADALQARVPDGVVVEQALVLGDLRREGFEEGADAVEEVEGRLHRDAADADVAGHHALAADGFEDAHEFFALAEAVEEDGERADVHGVRAEPDEVRVEPHQFHEEHTDVLGAFGDFELEELFDRERVAQVVAHRGEVVDAVGERDDLRIELGFAGFFDAGVQVANVGRERDDGFAVQLDDEAEHAVCRWVLWPHVEDHRVVGDRVRAVRLVMVRRFGDYVFDAGDQHVFGVAEAGQGGAGGVAGFFKLFYECH